MKFVIANQKRFGIHKAIKIADTNIGLGKGFKTYPLYSLGFIGKETEKLANPPLDVKNLKIVTNKKGHYKLQWPLIVQNQIMSEQEKTRKVNSFQLSTK